MCLLFLYHNEERTEGGYRIIIASNRDEFWDRPTKPAAFWKNNPDIISGVDIVPGREGGTWFAISKHGKIAVLLNILNIHYKGKRGRGSLVTDFLTCDLTAEEYIQQHVMPQAEQYNFFNLLLMDLRKRPAVKLYCNTNDKQIQEISAGIVTALDNSTLDKPWQKTVHGKVKFENLVKQYGTKKTHNELVAKLTELMNDRSQYADDEQLKKQAALANMTREALHETSACCVFSPSDRHGTRTNTFVFVDFDGGCEYIERTMKCPVDPDNIQWEVQSYKFHMSSHENREL